VNLIVSVVNSALVLMFIASASAENLDASAGNGSATVRNELHRGASAAEGCPGPDNLVLADCVYAAHLREMENKTATKAYMVGLFFDGWLRAAANPDIKRTHTAEGVARDMFFYLEQHRQELGLNLVQVCEGTRHTCSEVEPVWKEWETRTQKPRH
jgi:hypothetical protein